MSKSKSEWASVRTTIGLTGMPFAETIGGAFMAGMFLLYLTDYAGLGVLGSTMAPLILVIGRLIDFVIDPLLGWVIDSAKPRPFGKYRFFSLISIVLVSVATLLLFSIPEALKTRQALLFIWILAFYLLYSAASSLFTIYPLIQSIIPDTSRRSRLLSLQRLTSISIGVFFSFFMMLVNRLNERLEDFSRSFSTMASLFIGIALVISLTSLFLVHEGYERNQENPRIEIKDILDIFRKNKAFTVNTASHLFRGLVFMLMTATATYYTKWAYCTDPLTGEVDAALFGRIMVINGVVVLGPMLLAAVVSPRLIRRLGSAIRLINLSSLICAAGGLLMFTLHLTGILSGSYVLFIVLLAVMIFGSGLNSVPSQIINLECIDYNVYLTGKSMAGMIHALSRLLGKAQQALSTLAVGMLLAAVGYNVDSSSGHYAGDLANIPVMLSGFLVISALLPAIFSLISILINRLYPINEQIRQEMLHQQAITKTEDIV